MGCTVGKNHHGNLYFRLYHEGREWKEAIDPSLPDTRENRRRTEKRAGLIDAEIRAGAFNYLSWFPEGNRALEFKSATSSPTFSPINVTVEDYFDFWIDKLALSRLGTNALGSYRSHLKKWVLPVIGRTPCTALTGTHVRHLQAFMKQKGCSPTLINRTLHHAFRALVRDMRGQGLLQREIFDREFVKKFKEDPEQEPDPYSPEERTRILSWFFENLRHYYVFAYTRFWSGLRPGEATALRVRDIDPDNGIMFVRRSRSKGHEGVTKTRKRRAVRLLPEVVEVLRAELPRERDPNDFVFRTKGHLRRAGC